MFLVTLTFLLVFVFGVALYAEDDNPAGSYDPQRGVHIQSLQGYVQDSGGEALDSTYRYNPDLTAEEYQILLEFSEHGGRHRSTLVPAEAYKEKVSTGFKAGPKVQQGRRKRKKGLSFSQMAETLKKK